MKHLTLILMLLFVLIISACSNTSDEIDSDLHNGEDETSETEMNDKNEINEQDEAEREADNEATFTGSGLYKEQTTKDTIDIETEDGIVTFYLTKEGQEDVDYLKIGDEVTYTYFEDNGDNVIGFIEQSDYYDKPRHHHKHHKHERHRHHEEHHHHHGHHHRPHSNEK